MSLGYLLTWKILSRFNKGFSLRKYALSHDIFVYSVTFWGSSSQPCQTPVLNFDTKYAKTHDSEQRCAFWGSENHIYMYVYIYIYIYITSDIFESKRPLIVAVT